MEWNVEENRLYSQEENGELIAEATFERKENGDININHVYVNPKMRGQSLADKTMKAMVDYLREEGCKATATCTYADSWFDKNKELCKDILSKYKEM
ncbi:GNAT family N-acetyltransferase [Anaerosacchariphilus polymeriproducens]|uniref:N-acetyltransferase n=1 Tax=Anaerosacchariphilus polymeriproducens TaxID=1812858 RepID=A0A371AWU2_9FIRM|nr:GNAT family N-acetyltransferase [Anaerosacchariphilus polymeriproducens]RDU24054.1 N-acetyltransferase [Anaerosacchariphilus polymeriproducens]